jgi:hypothetical protein
MTAGYCYRVKRLWISTIFYPKFYYRFISNFTHLASPDQSIFYVFASQTLFFLSFLRCTSLAATKKIFMMLAFFMREGIE